MNTNPHISVTSHYTSNKIFDRRRKIVALSQEIVEKVELKLTINKQYLAILLKG